MDVSPFSHVPKLPSATVAVQPLVWLTVVAVAAAVLGLLGWRRRDVG
jgi:ABC-2 type transport system permease protein